MAERSSRASDTRVLSGLVSEGQAERRSRQQHGTAPAGQRDESGDPRRGKRCAAAIVSYHPFSPPTDVQTIAPPPSTVRAGTPVVMSFRARTRHTYDGTRRGGRMT